MVNKVTLIGNLGADPEVRRLENGAAVAKLSVATNENYRDKNGEWQKITEWHNVVVWRWLAERAEQYLKKGSLVFIEGKLTTRKWQDKDGNDRYTTEVVGSVMKSLDRREDSGGGYSSNFPSAQDAPAAPQRTNTATATNTTATPATPAADAAEDDLPF